MSWLGWVPIGAISLVVLFYANRLRITPRRHARKVAKAMLAAYRTSGSRYPHLSKERLYLAVLVTRPGVTPQAAGQILAKAKQAAGDSTEVRFWLMVFYVVTSEYTRYVRSNLSLPKVMERFEIEFAAGIREVLPVSSMMLARALQRVHLKERSPVDLSLRTSLRSPRMAASPDAWGANPR